jgi:radical SAM PhpK family P-methyltransferase
LEAEELNYLFSSIIDADIYINNSQGEQTLVNIIHALKNNQSIDGINNIYFEKDNKIVSTPLVKENNKLSENMVDWSIFENNVGEYVNVRTAISCPFSCSFCGFPQHAGEYQTAGVEAIEGELIELSKIKSLKSIHFVDDTFNIPKERFKKILKMIIRNQFEFKWHSYLRCQFIDKETVELMRESGCEGVFLGIESGNNQILKAMNKATQVQDYFKGIELLRENGIVTFGDFIIGFPGETEETVGDTVEFIKKSGLDFYRTQLWYYEHITPIFKERDTYKIKGDGFEWSHVTMDHKEACDIIENIYSSVRESVWIPQYNFDFDSIWHLKHRGMSINGIKKFLERFNLAVNNKLSNSSSSEVSYNALENIRLACSRSH